MQNLISSPISNSLNGNVRVPGDKSISHRSVMFSAIAEGSSHVSGLLEGDDVLATISAFRSMGVEIEGPKDGNMTVHGVGMHGLTKPVADLDMGNSGTAMRLLTGLLAAQSFSSTLVGDASLSKRPMKRVTDPLALMGAQCETESSGCPPIKMTPSKNLKGIHYDLPMASAQVKSAVLLAGLYADGETSVTEPAPTRNHTEMMLQAYGYDCKTQGNRMSVKGGGKLTSTNIDVPADISSATFFIVAASIVEDSDVTLMHTCINETRTGIIGLMRSLGANIELLNERYIGGEIVADIRVRYAKLKGAQIDPDLVPLAIDEFPAFFIAAACAEGDTFVTEAEELRHKESDRIAVMADGLRILGVSIEEFDDGVRISGGVIQGGTVECHHDHRIAMSFAVAGLVAKDPVTILDSATVATSFPIFTELGNHLGMDLLVEKVKEK
jgi:3-phosphoshikimate 1-carboxyvinyltransferase